MDKFDEYCPHPLTYTTCGKSINEEYNIIKDWAAVNSCIENSFDKDSAAE